MQKFILLVALLLILSTEYRISAHAKENSVIPDMELTNFSGLKFISHEAVKENRTSLVLNPNHAIHLNDNFTLDFEISFSDALYTFGYIFRMILDDEVNLDMVSVVSYRNLKLNVIYDQHSLVEFNGLGDIPNFDYEKWIPVSLTVDKTKDSILISIDGNKKSFKQKLKKDSNLKIYFGQSTHTKFLSSDVPPIAIRNIRILDKKNKPLYHWALGKHNGNMVRDEIRNTPAYAINPIWLIDKHEHWEKKISAIIPHGSLHIATNSDGKVYFAKDNYLAIYNNSLPNKGLTEVPVKGGIPFRADPNQMIYNPVKNQLISYDVDTQRFSIFDFTTAKWSLNDTVPLFTRFWHHNSQFIPEENKLVLFGGYGIHLYSSQLVVVDFSGDTPVWNVFDLSKDIPTRYLAGMTYDGKGNVLISGGYGSLTGSQSESPHNFYDLYRVNIYDGSVSFLYKNEEYNDTESFVYGNSTVLSNDGKTLYGIIYNDKRYAVEIRLISIDLETGEQTDYTSRIPYEFADIKSYCTLIHDKSKSELLVATTKLLDNNHTEINIYGLKFPPLLASEIIQAPPATSFFLYIVLILLLPVLCLILLHIIKKKRKETKKQPPVVHIPETPDYYNLYRVKKHPSSISLLGGFHVIDKTGKDITGGFTQTIRQLLMLIIIETYKNRRGISSERLTEIFWFDKDPENARNNRNVNMHKLRSLLQKVGDVDIRKDNSYWKFNISDSVFCDYSIVLQLFSELENTNDPDITKINDLLKLASFGKFLSNTQTEWTDPYKSEFTIRLIELLIRISENDKIKPHASLLLQIADTIMIHDSLDEDAIRIKCNALYAMGKKNQAKVCYDTFALEYEKILNTSPEFKLSDIGK